MKKLLFITPVILASQLAYGTQLYLGNSGSNLNGTIPAADTGYYYKCTNSVPFSCQSSSILINYSSKTGGAGTSSNPYILTGCSFVSCACSYLGYLSGTTCVECSNGLRANSENAPHTNSGSSACQYCPSHKLKISKGVAPGVYINSCEDCPANATCDGSTTLSCNKGYYGSTSCTRCPSDSRFMYQGYATYGTTSSSGKTAVTDCFIPSGTYYDNTGTFTITSNCPYK